MHERTEGWKESLALFFNRAMVLIKPHIMPHDKHLNSYYTFARISLSDAPFQIRLMPGKPAKVSTQRQGQALESKGGTAVSEMQQKRDCTV